MIDTFACSILRQLTKFFCSASLEARIVVSTHITSKKAAISDKQGNITSYFIKSVLLNGCDFNLRTYAVWNVLLM